MAAVSLVAAPPARAASGHAIDPSGALRLLQKSPARRGANWIEIVGFD